MNKEIIARLGQHVADTQVLWNKLHNLHWNVKGPQFAMVHEMTEGLYDEIAEHFDAAAERMLMLGAKPPVTVSECLKLAKIKETAQTSFTVKEVLSAVKEDLTYLLGEYRKTREMAAESDDCGTDSMLTDWIAGFEKRLWMIGAMAE